MKLSFVIPCYRSEKTIEMVINEIVEVVSQKPEYDYEIICVNDCSPDNVFEVLARIAAENKKVKVIDFMSNAGKYSAIMAGLSVAVGDIMVMLDDDFQCPASEVWNLIAPIESGEYDASSARYEKKMESAFKRFCSHVYTFVAHTMLGQPKEIVIENYLAISREVCNEIVLCNNPFPFIDGLILRVTKKISMVSMKERVRGDDNSTSFTFLKSMRLFVDGATAFSIQPLRFATYMGVILAIIGLIYVVITVVRYFVLTIDPGYSSLLSILLFIGGMLMIMLGIIGEYVGRIFMCINKTPQFVIKKTINI